MCKDSTPFLTIGIASYNYARFLPRAFEAIKKQNFTDYEILYSDDGSTDDSVKVIESFINDNPDMKIRLICGKNGGVMENKNRLLEQARGKYIMLCDADDWMEDDCLETLCSIAQKTGADQVAGAFQNIDENGHVLQVQEIPYNPVKWTWGIHHATIYNMDIIRRHNLKMQPDKYPDDVYFNMIFHEHSGKTEFVPKVLYNWYTHADSASARSTGRSNWNGLALLKSALSYVAPIYSACENADDKEQIEYMALKIYGLAIFYRNVERPFCEFLEEYKECHQEMNKAFPEYAKNAAYKAMDGKGYIRARTAKILWLTGVLEKMHLMPLGLWGYWIIAKKVTFGI